MKYNQFNQAQEDGTLQFKVKVACFVAAEMVANELVTTPNHANRLIWAKHVFEQPDFEAFRMLSVAVAKNIGLTPTQVHDASDSAIQNAVNEAIDLFAQGAS